MEDFARPCYRAWAVETSSEIKRWIARLKLAARRAKLPLGEVSRRVGYNPYYLSQLLRGDAKLAMHTVLALCRETRLHPAALFGDLYGFAHRLSPALKEEPGAAAQAEPGAEVERLREKLWLKIAESGLSQREVSRRLGEHYDYVNQVLRGNVELKVEHVLRILAALGLEPDEVFADFYGVAGPWDRFPDLDAELPGGFTRREIIAFFQQNRRALREALEVKRRAQEREVRLAARRKARVSATAPTVATGAKPKPGQRARGATPGARKQARLTRKKSSENPSQPKSPTQAH